MLAAKACVLPSSGLRSIFKITQDIGQVLAELPPVVKALSGVDLADLISKLPDIASNAANKGSDNNE